MAPSVNLALLGAGIFSKDMYASVFRCEEGHNHRLVVISHHYRSTAPPHIYACKSPR